MFQATTSEELARSLSKILHGRRHKEVASRTNSSPFTAKNWINGRHPPSAHHLIRLAQEYQDVRTWLIRLIEPEDKLRMAEELVDLKARLDRLEKRYAESS